MKNKVVKIKNEYFKAIKQMSDKQIAEFVKGICEYVYEGKPLITKDDFLKGVYMYVQRDLDESAQNSINGKKGAEILAERKRRAVSTNIEVVVVADKRGTAKVE